MPAILLCLSLIVFCVYMVLSSFHEFKQTRDTAYFWFGATFGGVLVFLVYGFMHFKPWLS